MQLQAIITRAQLNQFQVERKAMFPAIARMAVRAPRENAVDGLVKKHFEGLFNINFKKSLYTIEQLLEVRDFLKEERAELTQTLRELRSRSDDAMAALLTTTRFSEEEATARTQSQFAYDVYDAHRLLIEGLLFSLAQIQGAANHAATFDFSDQAKGGRSAAAVKKFKDGELELCESRPMG